MLAEAVLVTRILGIVTGARAIEAQVEPGVHSVEIVVDGRRAEELRGAPWQAKIDFGAELAPHELTAIARNEYGNEVGRDTQFINLARPHAELDIMFSRRADGKLLANVKWQHIGAAQPVTMWAKLDGKMLTRRLLKAIPLPESDSAAMRVLEVEMLFNDGSKARREVVFGGVYSEKLPAELTATVVRQRDEGRTDLARCFTSNGAWVEASAVDTDEADVVFVRATNPSLALSTLLPLVSRKEKLPESAFILPNTWLRFVWPAASRSGDATLFSTSPAYEGIRGVRWLLTRSSGPPSASHRMVDAVTVAGTEALRGGRRRAVVVVLGNEQEGSSMSPDVVKRYLARIGVPLYVWSLTGGTHPVWGEVEDISTSARLRDAVARLRRDLEAQRIAWLPLDPYRALHVQIADGCAWTR